MPTNASNKTSNKASNTKIRRLSKLLISRRQFDRKIRSGALHPLQLFQRFSESVGFHSDEWAALHVLMLGSGRLFCVSLDTLSYSPHGSRPIEARTHQSRISWFGEAVPNARAEIGDDGVKMGLVEHEACEEAISRR
jgi:hypothetical protein